MRERTGELVLGAICFVAFGFWFALGALSPGWVGLGLWLLAIFAAVVGSLLLRGR